jgi:hypothetical protein
MSQTRSEARSRYDVDTRIGLLESDADAFELDLLRINQRLDKLLWAMIGMIISLTTGAVLLAINLVVARGG